jgi:catechol 2,3-dioxygenase-like lactoylglutathione lyase family enzyme
MIEHTGVGVTDYTRSKAFYQAALAPLGYALGMEFGEEAAGFRGEDGHTDFWIEGSGANRPAVHVAFRAGSREAVQRFYRAALDAGAEDNGAPGLREDYGPDYYAAYVRDPDGHNIEAVCFDG